MNRNKRTLMSMIVFLSVFCLSAIINIPYSMDTVKSNDSKADAMVTTGLEASTTSTDDIELQPFSYKTSPIITYWNEENLALDETAETTNIQEDEAPTAKADEVATEDLSELDVQKTTVSEGTPSDETTSKDAAGTEVTLTEDVPEQQPEEALYSNIGISIAGDFVNIRKDASTDSEILGKLYKNSAAEILENSGEWYYVESGSVKGYVKSEYIKTGISDDELIENYGEHSIIVTVDGLNVREKADTESTKLTVIYKNEVYPVVELSQDWVKINIDDDNVTGYVKREFADLIVAFKEAVSKEEELELLQLQAEERAMKETEIKQQDSVSYSKEELKLLACLVHSEAGTQSYEGKLAVANVVLNRVNSSKYPGSIEAVIYQSGQFSVAKSGSLAKQLANFDNYSSQSQKLSIKAAKAALEGANNIGTRMYFHSYSAAVKKGYDNKSNCVKLGAHLFW